MTFPATQVMALIAAIKAGTLFDDPCATCGNILAILNWVFSTVCPAAVTSGPLTDEQKVQLGELKQALDASPTPATALGDGTILKLLIESLLPILVVFLSKLLGV